MAVPKAKKKKKPEVHQPPKDNKERWELIKTANYVVVAAIVTTLWNVYGWRHKRIAFFLEAILSLLDEARRFGYRRLLKDTYDLTGVDVKNLVDEVYDGK